MITSFSGRIGPQLVYAEQLQNRYQDYPDDETIDVGGLMNIDVFCRDGCGAVIGGDKPRAPRS